MDFNDRVSARGPLQVLICVSPSLLAEVIARLVSRPGVEVERRPHDEATIDLREPAAGGLSHFDLAVVTADVAGTALADVVVTVPGPPEQAPVAALPVGTVEVDDLGAVIALVDELCAAQISGG